MAFTFLSVINLKCQVKEEKKGVLTSGVDMAGMFGIVAFLDERTSTTLPRSMGAWRPCTCLPDYGYRPSTYHHLTFSEETLI